MLKLRRSLPDFVDLPLGAGAAARVRPATALDVDRASAFVGNLVKSGVALGDDGFELLALALGESGKALEITEVNIADCSLRLSTAKLSELCTESWSGVCDENGEPLPVTIATMLLLQADPMLRARFAAIVNAGIHEEVAEKNALAASPTGAAAADEATAPDAAKPASPAPPDCAAPAASSAPNSSAPQ